MYSNYLYASDTVQMYYIHSTRNLSLPEPEFRTEVEYTRYTLSVDVTWNHILFVYILRHSYLIIDTLLPVPYSWVIYYTQIISFVKFVSSSTKRGMVQQIP